MTPLPLILVDHDTPAGTAAGLVPAVLHALAQARSTDPLPFRRLLSLSEMTAAAQDQDSQAARQHVPEGGERLMDNLWLWPERLAGLTAAPALETSDPDSLPPGPAVIFQAGTMAPAVRNRLAARWDGPTLHLRVLVRENQLDVVLLDPSGVSHDGPILGRWWRDGFGRFHLNTATCAELPGIGRLRPVPAPAPVSTPDYVPDYATGPNAPAFPPHVLVVGEEAHLRTVYPAVLASLADAGDRMGLSLVPRVVSPRGLSTGDAWVVAREADAIVLPGGCDTSQVDGQIAVAGAVLTLGTPTLGCCFGMQTMVTAFARKHMGLPGAHLEEIAPDARPLAISAIGKGRDGLRHRLGLRRFLVASGSLAQRVYQGREGAERMHHRYHLAPWLRDAAREAGLSLSALGEGGTVVDAIELPGHPYFLGIQGHPELSGAPDRPHAAFTTLLWAARARARQRALRAVRSAGTPLTGASPLFH